MNPRPFAWTAGLLLVLLGVFGFVPALVSQIDDPLRISAAVDDPQLFGLLPVSPVLNLIHLGLGGWGMWAGRSLGHAVGYARKMAVAALVLTLSGTVPGLDTLFGAAPLWGNNLILHGLLALFAALFGFLYRRPREVGEPEETAHPWRDPDFL